MLGNMLLMRGKPNPLDKGGLALKKSRCPESIYPLEDELCLRGGVTLCVVSCWVRGAWQPRVDAACNSM